VLTIPSMRTTPTLTFLTFNEHFIAFIAHRAHVGMPTLLNRLLRLNCWWLFNCPHCVRFVLYAWVMIDLQCLLPRTCSQYITIITKTMGRQVRECCLLVAHLCRAVAGAAECLMAARVHPALRALHLSEGSTRWYEFPQHSQNVP
jgi:hypothetical protein